MCGLIEQVYIVELRIAEVQGKMPPHPQTCAPFAEEPLLEWW